MNSLNCLLKRSPIISVEALLAKCWRRRLTSKCTQKQNNAKEICRNPLSILKLNTYCDMSSRWENNEDIRIFQEYLRIPTVQPDVDYSPCVEFLEQQANDLDLSTQIYCPLGPTKPVVVITWNGENPNLPSIMLNSHMDVVPVYPAQWTYPPFSAHMDEHGKIFARGAQHMKSIGMQYLAAIRYLKKCAINLKRTVHITYVPDEEVGGFYGMKPFVSSEDFKILNVGFALDEGNTSDDDTFMIFYAERSLWHINFKITGTSGPASFLLDDTVGHKLTFLLKKLMKFRCCEEDRLNDDPCLTLGDITTLNLTKINGGVQSNVVPLQLNAAFDIRLPITVDHEDFHNQIKEMCEEAGGDIEIEFEQKEQKSPVTDLNDTNPFWLAFKESMDELKLKTCTLVLPGCSDIRFVRSEGIPALGFSPIINTPILSHDHNEYISAETYLRGIEIYASIISHLGNTEDCIKLV